MKMKDPFAILVAVMALAVVGAGRQGSDPPLAEMLQKAMDGSLEDSGVVGVSASILLPDGTLWKGAGGLSHEGVPMTTEMVFEIASVQKNLQAALALKLVEKGLMSLDDPLDRWLPSYPHIDGHITVRQLLSLTSGIDDFVHDAGSPWSVGYHNIAFEKTWTWEEILSEFVGEPEFKPGQACSYSTTNYILVRMIIERASRSGQLAELQDLLLGPNHMDHTWTGLLHPVPADITIAHGWYDSDGDGKPEDISGHSLNWIATLAPMAVYSTPGDMVRWIDALYHKKTVLGDGSLKEMLTFTGPVRNEPLMKGYGLGVVDIDIGALLPKWAGVRCHGHLGSQFGYTTFVGYLPAYGVSMAFMFNRGCDGDSERAATVVSGAVMDVLFRHLGVPETPNHF